MSEQETGKNAGVVALAFLAGAAIGAGLSLLLAPKTGEEMRETIRDFTGDALDKIKETTREAQEKIMSAIDQGKDMLMEKKSMLASALEAGKEAMQSEREKGGE